MTSIHDLSNAVETYFDAIHECSTEKLHAVFHPASSLFDADTGTVFAEPIDNFVEDVGKRISPASVGKAREAKILLITTCRR